MWDKEVQANNTIPRQYSVSVDVIIPVYKPDTKFNQLIERLTKQTVKPNRIILLQTVETETDSTEKQEKALAYALSLSSSICRIESYEIKKPDFDHGGTRNYGASLSQAEIIVFMTQDAVPADVNLINSLLIPFQDRKVAAAYGRQLAMQKSGIIESYTRQFNYPDHSYTKSLEDLPKLGIKTYFCSNVCAAYRKSVYEELSGFVTKTIFNEDMIMAAGIINAGYSITYAADARVYHSHIYTYMQQFKRNFDLAVSQKQYDHIFSSVKSETEGTKMVKQTLNYLIEKKQYILIPDLIFLSGFKYLGYLAGKNYDKLPKNVIKKLSLNPSYWN
ncbi:glycosyltransferase [Anaerocolumna sp. MB42-C2]|uniref:glycosyltransferase n=1 Tax=Anaerocolumna sp. MB42-C2 TaxID=3070997 RepID=UPI0027E11D05|nr:glycosyltransferase family 2 protein [Anaerocolumna sp. MB42-C2]WMJ87629.1 glycosyltransferase family 2 protein [Anaerocolumna sp. MB42-C2]